jgi:indolepyruvate ferredoxin oxidoreductase
VGRLIGQDSTTPPRPPTLDDIVSFRASELAKYQDAGLAERYRARIARIAEAERAKAPGRTGLAEAAARGYHKLLAYKDEYEVARLYASPEFEKALGEQFEGRRKLEFHLAPPLLARRDKATGEPRKMRFGPWMLPAFRLLAKGKRLRGTAFDVFGYSAERKLERQMIADYERLLDEVAQRLSPETHRTAVALASLALDIKGYGHIKQRNYKAAKAKEDALLAELRNPSPPAALKAAE